MSKLAPILHITHLTCSVIKYEKSAIFQDGGKQVEGGLQCSEETNWETHRSYRAKSSTGDSWVDKVRNMFKIYFKEQSEKFSEWRPCNENNVPVIQWSCTLWAERIERYVLKFQIMEMFSVKVVEGLHQKAIRGTNLFMKSALMKLVFLYWQEEEWKDHKLRWKF